MNEGNAVMCEGGFRCKVCGSFAPAPALPMELGGFIRVLRSFIDQHASCVPVEAPVAASPLFKKGERVEFDFRGGKVLTGWVERCSEPSGLDVLIKYHGGNFIWRKAKFVRLAPMPAKPERRSKRPAKQR